VVKNPINLADSKPRNSFPLFPKHYKIWESIQIKYLDWTVWNGVKIRGEVLNLKLKNSGKGIYTLIPVIWCDLMLRANNKRSGKYF
jgi:hypothetical protein